MSYWGFGFFISSVTSSIAVSFYYCLLFHKSLFCAFYLKSLEPVLLLLLLLLPPFPLASVFRTFFFTSVSIPPFFGYRIYNCCNFSSCTFESDWYFSILFLSYFYSVSFIFYLSSLKISLINPSRLCETFLRWWSVTTISWAPRLAYFGIDEGLNRRNCYQDLIYFLPLSNAKVVKPVRVYCACCSTRAWGCLLERTWTIWPFFWTGFNFEESTLSIDGVRLHWLCSYFRCRMKNELIPLLP